jgi:hypothetical protein
LLAIEPRGSRQQARSSRIDRPGLEGVDQDTFHVGPGREEEQADRAEDADQKRSVVDGERDDRSLHVKVGHPERSEHDKTVFVDDKAIRERAGNAGVSRMGRARRERDDERGSLARKRG